MSVTMGLPAGALDGIKVVDCSVAMSGAFATQRMGDLGADVIKVEPLKGEWQRYAAAGGAQGNRMNVSFLSLNRNKRSIALNLKSQKGRDIVYEMVADADVFLQNYRPGVAARLGVDYETLRQLNPKLVYVSISGYGEDGPYAHRPGQDMILQGMSGLMMCAGRRSDPPVPAGIFLVDSLTASAAFEGAMAALICRGRTGVGQLVKVNMLDTMVAIQQQEISVFTVGKKPQQRTDEPHAHCYIRAPYGVFATADGYIVVAMARLKELGAVVGEPAFEQFDEEVDGWARRDEIHRMLSDRLVTRTSDEWLTDLEAAGVWSGPVYGFADLLEDPQVKHNGSFITYDHPTEGTVTVPGYPYQFSATPPEVRRGAPLVGQHTTEVLRGLGRSETEIEGLLGEGVVAQEEL